MKNSNDIRFPSFDHYEYKINGTNDTSFRFHCIIVVEKKPKWWRKAQRYYKQFIFRKKYSALMFNEDGALTTQEEKDIDLNAFRIDFLRGCIETAYRIEQYVNISIELQDGNTEWKLYKQQKEND